MSSEQGNLPFAEVSVRSAELAMSRSSFDPFRPLSCWLRDRAGKDDNQISGA